MASVSSAHARTSTKRWALPRVSGTSRAWIFSLLIGIASVTLFLTVVRRLPPIPAPFRVSWYGLAMMFFLVEVFVVHLQFNRNAYSFSLSEVALVFGLFFTFPMGVVLAQVVGAAAALLLHRRQSLLKMSFNIAQFSLEATLATVIFHAIATKGSPVGPWGWLAAFAAIVATSLLQYLLIGLAISLTEGKLLSRALVQGLGLGLIVTATNISLGLVAAELMWRDPTAGWLLIVPITVLFFAYRAYNSEREKHQSLEFLYETTRTAQRYLNLDQALYTLLNQARQMFRAELADITLLPADGEELHRQTTLGPGDEYKLMEPVALDPTEGVWARVVSEGAAVLVRRPMQNERLREHYASKGIRDIMVAPLVVEDGVIGTLRVANRLGDVSTFDNEDLKLFETLANHATVSLENARLVAQLQSSLTHLTEMNRLKDDFVASVSHELRTPLTSIQGYVKTLLRPGVDFTHDEQHSFLSAVDRQSTRLATLIEDLLVVARLESNRLSLTLSPVSLPVVAERVVEELRVRAKDRAFKVSFAPDLSAVEGDEGKIHQIVSNLVDNALKYSPEDAPVSIAGMAEGDGVTISVTDFGPGIPADVQDKVFDRFYQVDQSATRKVGGAGLGLYICKSLATAFGGRLWLERSDETGSTFSLWIPATPPTELPPLIQSKVHPIGHAVNTL